MHIINYGTITLNQPLSALAIEKIKETDIFNIYDLPQIGDTSLEFDDFWNTEFEETLKTLVNILQPMGYVLDGTIGFFEGFGDYEGKILVRSNQIHVLSVSEYAVSEAETELLIEELHSRGFTVTKTE